MFHPALGQSCSHEGFAESFGSCGTRGGRNISSVRRVTTNARVILSKRSSSLDETEVLLLVMRLVE